MHKLVEEHLTRAITDRFNAGLKEPGRCEKTRQKVVDESLAGYRKSAGYGVSRETLAWALESIAVELETVREAVKAHCREHCEWVESTVQTGCAGHSDCPLFALMCSISDGEAR